MRIDPAARFASDAGIAIGPILFVLAILALLAAVMASGNGQFQVASGADRITADVVAQGNMIRGAINQCNLQYTLAVSTGSVSPYSSDPPGAYPSSDTTNGTTIGSINCTPMGGTSMWSAVLLPPPTQGFNAWTYINAGSSGGRCIWTSPTESNPAGDLVVTSGLTRAAAKFNSGTSYAGCPACEVLYNPSSATQKFIIWITPPTGSATAKCTTP